MFSSGTFRQGVATLLFAMLLLVAGQVSAQPIEESRTNATPSKPGTDYTLRDSTAALKYELGALTAGIGILGVNSWDWGSSSFRMNSEGWFGMNTGSGGTDKLGHMYSSYVISEFLRSRLLHHVEDIPRKRAARDGALFSFGLMTVVELFDGVSSDHGFSYEDMVLNSLGIGFSYLRGISPKLGERLDLRWQYWPSSRSSGFHPVTDYEGQTFLIALKPAGFDLVKETPLKYLELHAGYSARGFKRELGFTDQDRRTALYLGVAFNLEELIFRPGKDLLGRPGALANTLLKYIQIPDTSLNADVSRREL